MVIVSNNMRDWFIVRIILKDKASAIQILKKFSCKRIKVGLHYLKHIKNHKQLFIHFGMLFKTTIQTMYFSDQLIDKR